MNNKCINIDIIGQIGALWALLLTNSPSCYLTQQKITQMPNESLAWLKLEDCARFIAVFILVNWPAPWANRKACVAPDSKVSLPNTNSWSSFSAIGHTKWKPNESRLFHYCDSKNRQWLPGLEYCYKSALVYSDRHFYQLLHLYKDTVLSGAT